VGAGTRMGVLPFRSRPPAASDRFEEEALAQTDALYRAARRLTRNAAEAEDLGLRGTYFDLLAEPPGAVTRTDDELLDAFRSGAAWGEEAAGLRAAFREKFCSLEDGRAAERVVRRVWLGEKTALERGEAPVPVEARADA
jgi:hypothetical protein